MVAFTPSARYDATGTAKRPCLSHCFCVEPPVPCGVPPCGAIAYSRPMQESMTTLHQIFMSGVSLLDYNGVFTLARNNDGSGVCINGDGTTRLDGEGNPVWSIRRNADFAELVAGNDKAIYNDVNDTWDLDIVNAGGGWPTQILFSAPAFWHNCRVCTYQTSWRNAFSNSSWYSLTIENGGNLNGVYNLVDNRGGGQEGGCQFQAGGWTTGCFSDPPRPPEQAIMTFGDALNGNFFISIGFNDQAIGLPPLPNVGFYREYSGAEWSELDACNLDTTLICTQADLTPCGVVGVTTCRVQTLWGA